MRFQKSIITIFIAAAVSGISAPAFAEWNFIPSKSSFGDTTFQLIGVSSPSQTAGRTGFLFQCKKDKKTFGMYALFTQQISESEYSKILLGEPQLLFRVDQHEVIKMKVYPDRSNEVRFMLAENDDLYKVIAALQSAKNQIAVAVSINDSVRYESNFDRIGLDNSVTKFGAECIK
ncbi:MAG: hypothetical protein COB78_12745 [Hyphomicrobiales bacterium]|nr:MAG: hypothetical protein COB78_12745 [Hyphomicrobiales bacterium]